MVVLQFSNKTVARQDRSLIPPKNFFALIQTSFDHAPVRVWPGNPKGGPNEVSPLLDSFPKSDHEWMALQQHVIDITGKPIEDVAWGDLSMLRAALTEAEMNAVLFYRRRKNLETSTAFQGIKRAGRRCVASNQQESTSSDEQPSTHVVGHYWEKYNRRLIDIEKLCKRAVQLGVITRTGHNGGSKLYFGGAFLTRGIWSAVTRMADTDFELEADLRVAVRAAVQKAVQQ